MKVGDLLKKLLKNERITQARLAERLGYRGQSSVSTVLRGEGVSVTNTLRICEELGYDVIIAKKRPGRKMTEAHYLNEIIDFERTEDNG